MTAFDLDAEQIARVLGGEVHTDQKIKKDFALVPGPGHSARDRSLSILPKPSAPDGFLVHSFANDDPIACRRYVCEKLMLPAPERKPARTNGAREPRPRQGGEWIYRTSDGEQYLRVVRLDKPDGDKTYPQSRWENGSWVSGKPKGPKIPYRLPQLVKAPPDAPVFICEGEKCADAVARHELVATSASEGAGKWKPDLNEWFKGRAVYILPDRDEPGAKHAQDVARNLHGIARDVRIVELPGLTKDGDDVADWLALGNTPETLLMLAEQAPQWRPQSSEQEQAPHQQKQQPSNVVPLRTAPSLISARASAIEMHAIEWLWPNRFALGKVGLIVGMPDEGKGQIFCDMAARTTRGDQWPCGEGSALQGRVIMLTAEDDPADTVVPRLAAAGADLDAVEIVKMVRDAGKERMFSLVSDLELLRHKITEVGNVRLVQIDPVSAYLGVKKMDSFRTTDVRAVLGPLAELASAMHVSIVGIMHFNKKVDVTNALLRISDSLAFGAVSRHVFAVVDDEQNQRKLLVRAKNNLAPRTIQALAYGFGVRNVGYDKRLDRPIDAPHIEWLGHVDVTATEAMQAANERKAVGARDEAKELLAELLANGPLPQKDIEDAAEANCIAKRTLKRAKKDMQVVSKKDAPDGGWTWRLPDKKPTAENQ